jgi:predicted dehydrogenase
MTERLRDPKDRGVIRLGVVGLGKMGISHLSMINAHPDVSVEGVCDPSGYLLSIVGKYSGLRTFSDMDSMLRAISLDAVVISTPSSMHAPMVGSALDAGLHVFCEKPFVLDPSDGERLVERAESLGLVTQVGYHNRFIGAFAEVKRLLDLRAIGDVTHVLAESYGPVVLKPQGGTWRSKRAEGGGSLYDYAAHTLNLLNWYFGEPTAVGGTILHKVFSRETEDEVASTLLFERDVNAQLSVNWSDESQRKMTTKVTIWGTHGRIAADRQECQVYLRDTAPPPAGYITGWNVRYTTELTEPVWFYVRGEEYSAQLDEFVRRIAASEVNGTNDFRSSVVTDRTIAMLVADAERGFAVRDDASAPAPTGTRVMDRVRTSPIGVGARQVIDRIRSAVDAARRRAA